MYSCILYSPQILGSSSEPSSQSSSRSHCHLAGIHLPEEQVNSLSLQVAASKKWKSKNILSSHIHKFSKKIIWKEKSLRFSLRKKLAEKLVTNVSNFPSEYCRNIIQFFLEKATFCIALLKKIINFYFSTAEKGQLSRTLILTSLKNLLT